VLDVLINDGALSEADVRARSARKRMDWIDISTMIIPPQVINEIRGEDARRFKVISRFGETGCGRSRHPLTSIPSTVWVFSAKLELVC
jgi:hypothetical protein